MGPLQARPAHRPCPRRRSAGHQRRAMGHRPARWSEEFSPASSEAEGRVRTLFMVGDFKQAIYGFQGTDPQRIRRRRATESASAREALSAARTMCRSRALEFRDLSINASFRSAQAVLDAVDAVIDDVGFGAMGLPELPPPHVAHHSARPGIVELWKPFAVDDDRGGRRRARRAGSMRGRAAICRRARRPGRATGSTRRRSSPRPAAADAGRYPDPGAQPGRACIADRRAAVRSGRAGRGDRPAVPSRSRLRCGPAGGGDLRGPAARRSQPRQPAGVAADRLGPGAAVAISLTGAEGALWRELRDRARRARGFRGGACAARRTAGDGRLHDAVALPGDDPLGPLQGRRKLYSPPRAWRRATRSTS